MILTALRSSFPMLIARLTAGPGAASRAGSGDDPGAAAVAVIRAAIRSAWPGYDLAFVPETVRLPPSAAWRIAFLHACVDGVEARLDRERSDLALGDAVVVAPDAVLELDRPASFVVYTIPEAVGAEVPRFLRPDVDPRLTDTPGGCATDVDAYRRVMLTWLAANGPYTCRALNCHRVRMTDSFSHYHPIDGGFEECYLVHEVRPGACLHWSPDVARIEDPGSVDVEIARGLVRTTELRAGDLVFIPRGTMHRAVGGVLAHVVTIPGFVPACEIGVDHHLRAIDERLGLTGDSALPYQVAASRGAVVK